MLFADWEKQYLAMLSEMATGVSNTWTKGKMQIYLMVLRSLGEEAARRTVNYAVMNCKWRPEPAELREIAAKLYSPLPPVGEMWRECWHKAITQGYDRPQWSHPAIGDIVTAIGGWRYLRSVCWLDSDARFREGLQRRFETAYTERAESWWKQVADQLQFPPEERDPHYFPAYEVFNPPALLPPASEETEAGSREEAMLSIEEVRRMLRDGINRIGNGKEHQ